MARTRQVRCVQHRDGWCATFRNAKPSADAVHDKTACGAVVNLRHGEAFRVPTCEECRARVRRRRR